MQISQREQGIITPFSIKYTLRLLVLSLRKWKRRPVRCWGRISKDSTNWEPSVKKLSREKKKDVCENKLLWKQSSRTGPVKYEDRPRRTWPPPKKVPVSVSPPRQGRISRLESGAGAATLFILKSRKQPMTLSAGMSCPWGAKEKRPRSSFYMLSETFDLSYKHVWWVVFF